MFVRGVRLVYVHHHGPLEVGDGAGYCVQTLEGRTSPAVAEAQPQCRVDLPCSASLTRWRRSGAGELEVIGAEASSRRRGYIGQAVKSEACLNTAPCHVHWCAAGNTRVRSKPARSREVHCIRIRG